MFGLLYDTPIEWVARVEALGLDLLLSDHAHCELKAAATMQALIAKNCEHAVLVEALPAVAMEELEHFQQVHAILQARGGTLHEQDTSPYADGMRKASASSRHDLLLDRLLLSHLIEARSAERFHLLSLHLQDRELAALYAGLMPSESAHRVLFFRLAAKLFPASAVDKRLAELQRTEAEVIRHLPLEARIHSGPE